MTCIGIFLVPLLLSEEVSERRLFNDNPLRGVFSIVGYCVDQTVNNIKRDLKNYYSKIDMLRENLYFKIAIFSA